MEIVKYYILNLPHRTDRKQAAEVELKKAGIDNYEFLESTHWKNIKQEELDRLINLEYRHVTKDMNAKYALTGCGHSHLQAIKKFIEVYGVDGTQACVIFEDDFEIVDHSKIKQQIYEAINVSPNWDFIYLGGLRNAKQDKREEYLPNLDIAISVWNAHAYVIRNTQDIYDRVLNLFNRGFFADRAFRKMIRDDKSNKERYLITHPYTVIQRKNFSDINNCVR